VRVEHAAAERREQRLAINHAHRVEADPEALGPEPFQRRFVVKAAQANVQSALAHHSEERRHTARSGRRGDRGLSNDERRRGPGGLAADQDEDRHRVVACPIAGRCQWPASRARAAAPPPASARMNMISGLFCRRLRIAPPDRRSARPQSRCSAAAH
jgi:hypothetical protein